MSLTVWKLTVLRTHLFIPTFTYFPVSQSPFRTKFQKEDLTLNCTNIFFSKQILSFKAKVLKQTLRLFTIKLPAFAKREKFKVKKCPPFSSQARNRKSVLKSHDLEFGINAIPKVHLGLLSQNVRRQTTKILLAEMSHKREKRKHIVHENFTVIHKENWICIQFY